MCQVGECTTKFRNSVLRCPYEVAVSISPTPMDRWRISVMGKPVLSLPINDPFRIPIRQAEGMHWCRARERNRFLFYAGIKFLQYVAGTEVSGIVLRLSRWIKVLSIYCLYSASYLLLINRKFQILKF